MHGDFLDLPQDFESVTDELSEYHAETNRPIEEVIGVIKNPEDIESILRETVEAPLRESTLSKIIANRPQNKPGPAQAEALQLSDKFDLARYKISWCANGSACNKTFCLYYHFIGERRRIIPLQNSMCPQIDNCPNGDQCVNCHTLPEYLYHPQVYKQFACTLALTNGQCELRDFCPFTHEKHEIKEERPSITAALVNQTQQLTQKHRKLVEKFAQVYREYRPKAECNRCLQNDKKVVMSPCGHALCVQCNALLLGRCALCRVRAQEFSLNFY